MIHTNDTLIFQVIAVKNQWINTKPEERLKFIYTLRYSVAYFDKKFDSNSNQIDSSWVLETIVKTIV